MTNIVAIVIGVLLSLALIIWLFWKNKKDKDQLNPDTQDSVEKVMMDQDRNRDRI
jgi:LPXTG-motif cell wall-anchored protein